MKRPEVAAVDAVKALLDLGTLERRLFASPRHKSLCREDEHVSVCDEFRPYMLWYRWYKVVKKRMVLR